MLYIVLYVLFKKLIKEREGELDSMKGHVDGFFMFMILIQTGSLIFSLIFYVVNDPTVDRTTEELRRQEFINTLNTFTNLTIELVFNTVMIFYLLGQTKHK